MFQDMFGIPTGYVSDTRIVNYIYSAASQQAQLHLSDSTNTNNNVSDKDSYNFPPIMANFNLYMGPEEMDSKSCLSWLDTDGSWSPKCLPLGGNSIWAVAGSPYTSESNDGDNDNDNANNRERRAEDEEKQPIVMVATNMDESSMFHEAVPGANTAAANILTVLMGAKIFGASVTDETLDNLENKL